MSIFSDTLSEKLRLDKYASWATDLTEDQIEGLLWLIGEWGYRPDPKPGEEPHGAQRRAFAARAAIHDFTHKPLTIDEVLDLIREARDQGEKHDAEEAARWDYDGCAL